ncbi:MAG: hypothetical protein HW386_365 [Gammaproteobacteria bacterium]|nr:hypothetical protein [Gammaproteobacteria bacterium]
MKPELEFVFEAKGKLGSPILLGETYEGVRRIIPILEGSFTGPNIRGTIITDGAADWQHMRHDNVTQAEATYALRTHDGVVIQVQNFGLRHGPEAVIKRLAAGEMVDPGEYYFRSNPRFKAPSGLYDWLNKSIFVCSGARFPDAIQLWFYRVT